MILFLTKKLETRTITINILWQCFKGRKRYESQDGVSAGHVHHGAASKIFDAPADTCDLSSGSLKSGTKSNALNNLDLSKNQNDATSEFKLSGPQLQNLFYNQSNTQTWKTKRYYSTPHMWPLLCRRRPRTANRKRRRRRKWLRGVSSVSGCPAPIAGWSPGGAIPNGPRGSGGLPDRALWSLPLHGTHLVQ